MICKRCNYITRYITIKNKVFMRCNRCDINTPANDDIVSYNYKETPVTDRIIRAIIDDNHTYPSVVKKMPGHTCGNDRLSYWQNLQTLDRIYVCRNCESYWQ